MTGRDEDDTAAPKGASDKRRILMAVAVVALVVVGALLAQPNLDGPSEVPDLPDDERDDNDPGGLVGREPDNPTVPDPDDPNDSDPPADDLPTIVVLSASHDEPVVGLDLELACYDTEVAPVRLVTDEMGQGIVPSSMRDRYCVAAVTSGEWTLTSESAFFASGRHVIRARRGCAVFVRIAPSMDALVGLPCVLMLGNRPVEKPLEGLTTLVGYCNGGLAVLMRVGEHEPRLGTSRYVLPETGEVFLDFVPRDSVDPTLVIEAPSDPHGACRFRFVPATGDFRIPIDVRRPEADGDSIAVALPPGDYDYLGTWGAEVCDGRVLVSDRDEPTHLSPSWSPGETVVFSAGDGAPITEASLQLTPASWRLPLEEGLWYAPSHAGRTAGVIVLDDRVVYAPRTDWWKTPILDGPAVTWTGVPRGAALAHRIATSGWARRTVIEPGWAKLEEAQVAAPFALLVNVEPSVDPFVRIEVGQRFDPSVRGPVIAVGRADRGVARVLLGLPESWSRGLELAAEARGRRGQATWSSDEPRRVTIDLASVGTVRYEVQVVDRENNPVVGAPVSVSRREQAPLIVPTDGRGRARVDLPRGEEALATVGGADFDGGFVRLVEGEVAVLRAHRVFRVELENERAENLQGVIKIEPSRQSDSDEPVTLLSGGVIRWGRLPRGTYRITMTSEDGTVIFSDTIEVGGESTARVVIR